MRTVTAKKPARRVQLAARNRRGYRLVKDPISGLTVTKGPVGSPRVSSARIKAISAEYP